MKVLLCTHHLQTWGGSELVCIELFEALVARGCEVSVYCPFATPAFIQIAFGNWLRVEGDPARIDLEAFDLVLVSHQCLSRLWTPAFERRFASLRRRPFLIYFHLSPHEPFEQPGPFVERALADVIYANSEETRDALVDQGFAGIRLFRNPAPEAFAAPPSRSRDLRRLLSISNHLPSELGEAFEILKARGIEVTRIGNPQASRRVTPRDLESHEAVITIGKSVQYAIRSRRPVFCYDHFQGPGWLGPLNAATEATNFSGRCSRIPLSGPNLAERILGGFAAARDWIAQADPAEFGRFFLERSVDEILELARLSRRRWHWTLWPGGINRHRDFETERRLYELVDRSYAAGSSLPAPAGPALPSLFRTHRAIETKMLRPPKPDEAMVIAVFSYRYDAHLVPHLIENIAPAVHGYAALDDRMAGDMLSAETGRQKALFETARNMGARWVFAVDPDERFEDRLKDQMPALTTGYGPVVWTFECRELFHPTRYRIDGLWSGRPRARLFPCIAGMEPGDTALHGLWTRNHWKLPVKASGLDFYHLRMITPERRALRRALYASADLGRAFQDIGYDYLDDERGMQLREIQGDRGFTPPHVEDHRDWAPASSQFSASASGTDPLPHVMRRLIRTRGRHGFASAASVAFDLADKRPKDAEIALLAADSALRAGAYAQALDACESVATLVREPLLAYLLATRAHAALGQHDKARAALDHAVAISPIPDIHAAERHLLTEPSRRFASDLALWRRWIDPASGFHAEVHDGPGVASGPLAVVVMGLNAPDELEAAVASLRAQSVQPEIVVVNSGGGDPAGVLKKHLDVIRLITIDGRLFPGAVRNIGIDASAAPYVSFLASDCVALPGWVAARIDAHSNGYRAVAASVVPRSGRSTSHLAAWFLLHANRRPGSLAVDKQKYSLSYDRALFDTHGYFPPGLRIGEDTAFNERIGPDVEIASDDRVTLAHSYPDSLDALRDDIRARARRRMLSDRFPSFDSLDALDTLLAGVFNARHETARAALDHATDIDGPTRGELIRLIEEIVGIEQKTSREVGRDVLKAKALGAEAKGCLYHDSRQACRLMEEALSIWPQSAELTYLAALCFSMDKQPASESRAIQLATQALSMDPTQRDALVLAIQILAAKGRTGDACRIFFRTQLLAPQAAQIIATVNLFLGPVHRAFRIMMWQKGFFLTPWSNGFGKALGDHHRMLGSTDPGHARNNFVFET